MKVSHLLLTWTDAVLPPRRRVWGEAMQAELAAIADPRAAFSFALGCFTTACYERVISMFGASLLAPARFLVLSVTALWGAYWVVSPWLFISTNGMGAATGAFALVILSLLALRGVMFLLLAYGLAAWRARLVTFSATALVPLSLLDFGLNIGRPLPLVVHAIGLVVAILPLALVCGACTAFWKWRRVGSA